MAGLSKGSLERLKQRAQQGAQLAGAQVSAYAGHDPQPAPDASPDDWAAWVGAAQGRAAAAVLELGRRIAVAHDAYTAQPQRWGRTWEDWCQQQLGLGRRSADRLRAIAVSLNSGHAVSQILPADQQALYSLARLRQQHPDAFDAAIAAGVITPQLTRADALALLKAAQGGPAALPAAVAEDAPQPVFRRWHGMTLASDALDQLQALAEAQKRSPEDLAAELLEQAIARLG